MMRSGILMMLRIKMKIKAKSMNFPFVYLYDETQAVAKSYDAACTPDFIYLMDHENWSIVVDLTSLSQKRSASQWSGS